MTITSERIKSLAREVGFLDCGITPSEHLVDEEAHLQEWLNRGYHGTMSYMENHFDKRLDPSLLVPGSKSVISLIYNYYPEQKQTADAAKIAKYAYGTDYHYVVKDRMAELIRLMEEEGSSFNFRMFVDSGPVLERALAEKAGLGWIGKHSLLINKKYGSFFFIAEIICDLELEYDQPVSDHCGTCTACIDACPTEAIVENKVVDSTRCISYLTIESKEPIPERFHDQMNGWAFGCDICQDVCPWNRFSVPHQEEAFKPNNDLLEHRADDWLELSANQFKKRFRSSPIYRTGNKGFKRNLSVIRKDE
ncbi:MAG: tRNA epoxyqueuosine(34) reductase QueG [Flavobacteriales bacterium]|nr:tRNA epoxyqueuosine(34) reductase QueG [Bacteroidota bacterium]MCB9239674.1 tRNA epoxyqueuosine(34) reductase QueG [Flavobacteriales bacterium]